MKRSIKEAAKNYYGQFSLTDSQVNDLRNISKKTSKKCSKTESYKLSKKAAAIAASVILAISLVGSNAYKKSSYFLRNKLVEEIAYNHHKNLELEFISPSLNEVRQYFKKLDFMPVSSKALPASQWKLIGGRYCSIQNRLAAQIRVRNKTNDVIHTWYQVSGTHNPVNIPKPYEIFKNGIKVRIWKEKGVIHGLAGVE